ncbi:hypothetical protein D3C87_2190140 [compost metagenome]
MRVAGADGGLLLTSLSLDGADVGHFAYHLTTSVPRVSLGALTCDPIADQRL